MSQQPPASQEKDLAPPEERFWKRYSPHHEFPLSSVGSVVLHILSIGALIVVGYVITRTRGEEQSAPPSLDVLAAPGLPPMNAGGGGDPGGSEKAPGGTQTKGKVEIAANQKPQPPRPGNKEPEKAEKLEDVKFQPIQVEVAADGTRTIVGENRRVIGDLNVVVDQAQIKLAQAMARANASKGKGGPGKDGGKGSGEGPGVGPGKGPGIAGGEPTIRQRRQNRWKMFFSTAGGEDYLRQIRGLKAYLGIPRFKGDQLEYLLIKDPRKGAIPVREDVSKLNRIFWFDKETRSVLSVSQALGLRPPPPFFVAFFPPELEEKLRRLEEQAFSGDENQILETRFRVVNRDGVYDVELDPVNPIVRKFN